MIETVEAREKRTGCSHVKVHPHHYPDLIDKVEEGAVKVVVEAEQKGEVQPDPTPQKGAQNPT